MEAEMDSFMDDNIELNFFDCFDEEDNNGMMKYIMYHEMEESEEEQLLFDMLLKTSLLMQWRKHQKSHSLSFLQSKADLSKGKRGNSF
eukprot:14675955-Ditylum_brightwellii.AAC.1